jgi:hypothetical protein
MALRSIYRFALANSLSDILTGTFPVLHVLLMIEIYANCEIGQPKLHNAQVISPFNVLEFQFYLIKLYSYVRYYFFKIVQFGQNSVIPHSFCAFRLTYWPIFNWNLTD